MTDTAAARAAIEAEKKAEAEKAAAEKLRQQLMKDLSSAQQALNTATEQAPKLTSDLNLFTTVVGPSTVTFSAQSSYVRTTSGFIGPGGSTSVGPNIYTAYWILHTAPPTAAAPQMTNSSGQPATWNEVLDLITKTPKPSWYTPKNRLVIEQIIALIEGANTELNRLKKEITTKQDLVATIESKLLVLYWTGKGTTVAEDAENEEVEDTPEINPIITSITTWGPGAQYGAYNPPPHAATRSVTAPTLRLTEKGQYWGIKGRLNDDAVVKKFTASLTNRLGFIFQDPDVNLNVRKKVAVTKKNPSGYTKDEFKVTAKDGTSKTFRSADQLWGFQFAYNPGSIRQSLSVDVANDWTLQDPANALAGTGSISFELWLNRIMDFQVLKYGVATQAGYARKLDVDDVNGILNRGTNYDLEFLFRVINGDPSADHKHPDTNTPSSDYGYITGIPVWVNFGGGQKYKVSIRGMGIDHVMFTSNMVPVLTKVTLEFARIPIFATGSGDAAANAGATPADIVQRQRANAEIDKKDD